VSNAATPMPLTSVQTLILPADAHNRLLVDNVHPLTWVNPTPSGRYNLVVLGAGTAGLVSAAGAAGLGAKVALVEKHLMGGDCLNFGCVPSKGLLRAARAAQDTREAEAFGVGIADSVTFEFSSAMERMRRLRANISEHDSAHRLSKLGVDVFFGAAKFVARDAAKVGGQTLLFSRAVIATGTRAASPAITGAAGVGFLTNETVFSLTELPRRLAVIGAGPVGCELAQAFRRFGSEVFLFTRGSRLLPREDADAAGVLAKQFNREGIHVALGAKILRAEKQNGAKALVFQSDGQEDRVVADEILVAVGRAPNVEGLNLDAAEVAFDNKGVTVDDYLRTSNRRIYAAGDICSPYKFTHVADATARVVLQNALFFGRKKASALVIPWCTYTDPEVAHVGLYEKEARERGLDLTTLTVPLKEVDRAVLDGDENGFARVHAEKRSGRVLGATLVARHAGEMISEMSLAVTAGLGLGTIAKAIHPYPTQAEAWKRLGDDWNRSRLTPRLRNLFARYLSWRR
jgi:pyruvate/2-oxoglutarate dehydrogenase complex dihydrolipoamide dehydrogenase (E3) component